MSRNFVISKDYYSDGYNLYKKKSITIDKGVTVLVGCNGSGKTTLIYELKNQLAKNNIPVILFNNLKDGGNNAISAAVVREDYQFLATAISSSEGENIVLNLSRLAYELGKFTNTGKVSNPQDKFVAAVKDILGNNTKEEEIPNERWILMDSVDSGLSVDNIVELKESLFKVILEHNQNREIYIVVSANEYELCRNENCFDVYEGKYITFADYEEYRNFVLESKKKKDKR